jgi:hypothetical protein
VEEKKYNKEEEFDVNKAIKILVKQYLVKEVGRRSPSKAV